MHLRCHLLGQLNMVPGAGTLSHCQKLCIQADLYSGAWVRSGGSMLPADFILLTNSIDYPTFWNLNALDIFHATPAVNAPICEWMYVRYINDDHCPTHIIVESDAPLSFMAIAPPALRLWDDMRSRV
jgi:hypothetical protein